MSYTKTFKVLFSLHGNKPFELDALQLGELMGYSRKTVYQAVLFLRRARLLEVIQLRKGRGNRSTYRLRWRKLSRKRHPIRTKVFKRPHICETAPNWNRMMARFRELVERANLPYSRTLVGVLGKYLKGKTHDQATSAYYHLKDVLRASTPPQWAKTIHDTCCWFSSLVRPKDCVIRESIKRVDTNEDIMRRWKEEQELYQTPLWQYYDRR